MSELREIGERIRNDKPFDLQSALECNKRIEKVFGTPNPLHLNSAGFAPVGFDLNDYISGTILNIASMQDVAVAKGKVTQAAQAAVDALIAVLNDYLNRG